MDKAYSALSKVYEYLICDCDYENWSQYLLNKINSLLSSGTVIDCACGSGFFTRAIKRGGYKVVGVDSSTEMLSEATKKTAESGLNIPYRVGDMASLKSFEKVDLITVINDGINYLSPDKVQKAFKSFAKTLESGGYLMFDVSSEYKITNILGNNMFGEDDENCSYMWFNRQGDGYVDMDIVLFTRSGNLYQKSEESHRQYAHSVDFLKTTLEECGFCILEINEHLGKELTEKSERIEFIAKKV